MSSGDIPVCIVCCEPITCYAVGVCGHKDMCANCVFKRRRLYGQCTCAICKDPLNIILFSHNSKEQFPLTNKAFKRLLDRSDVEFVPDPPDQAKIFQKAHDDYEMKAREVNEKMMEKAAAEAAKAAANAKLEAELQRFGRSAPVADTAFPALPSSSGASVFPQSQSKTQKKGGPKRAPTPTATKGKKTIMTINEPEEEKPAKNTKELEPIQESIDHEPGVVCIGESVSNRIHSLTEFRCVACSDKKRFGSLDELKNHLRDVHQLYFCEICLQDRKVFLEEQVLMRASELVVHMTQWDGGVSYSLQKMLDEQDERRAALSKNGKQKGPRSDKPVDSDKVLSKWKPMLRSMATGHPLCKFCNERFYGIDQLYEHLTHCHISCPVCEKLGNPWQFFRDMKELVSHYGKKHYLCRYPGCMMGFATSFDLKVHMGTEHNSGISSTSHGNKMVLETHFTVRRQARNGEGIEEDNEYRLGTLIDPDQYRDAQHQQRIRAAQMRSQSPTSSVIADFRSISQSTEPPVQSAPQQQQKSKKKKGKAHTPEEVEDTRELEHPVAERKEEGSGHKLRIERRQRTTPPIQQPEPEVPKTDVPKAATPPVVKSKSPKAASPAKTPSPEIETPTPVAARPSSPAKEPVAAEMKSKSPVSSESSAPEVVAQGAGGFCNTEGMSITEKNQLMVTIMKSMVSDSGFTKFKQYSAKYRSGELNATEYYKSFFNLFGTSEQTKELFSLLASLLPDSDKRMELLQLHTINCAPRPAFHREEPRSDQQVSVQQKKNKNKRNKGRTTPGVVSTDEDDGESTATPSVPVSTPAESKKEDFPTLPRESDEEERMPSVAPQHQNPPRQKKNKKQNNKAKRPDLIEEIPEGVEGVVVFKKLH